MVEHKSLATKIFDNLDFLFFSWINPIFHATIDCDFQNASPP